MDPEKPKKKYKKFDSVPLGCLIFAKTRVFLSKRKELFPENCIYTFFYQNKPVSI